MLNSSALKALLGNIIKSRMLSVFDFTKLKGNAFSNLLIVCVCSSDLKVIPPLFTIFKHLVHCGVQHSVAIPTYCCFKLIWSSLAFE